ncbi:hypothetical protein Ae201684_011078 [Aphanomyces euteiches]|uniref:Uncharacterized protein n=1 Tax=Aphanomyces euteiches TaxID=100861 RepID=A0A6G0WWB1_9STRA|nr:hypothetical protein Ae201684_011078 [Aphanomyces euteiches]
MTNSIFEALRHPRSQEGVGVIRCMLLLTVTHVIHELFRERTSRRKQKRHAQEDSLSYERRALYRMR